MEVLSSKLIPSDPDKVMVLRKVTPDILTCSVPFLRFGRVNIGGRGTIVRLQNGTLAVFSPTALTDNVRSSVREMGDVKYIAATDQEHHIFLDSWHEAYPSAKLLGPDTLGPKRDKQGKGLPWATLYKKSEQTKVDPDFDREFECEYVDAHANKELVFLHKPSKTLIEADFLFNLPAHEQMSKTGQSADAGWLTRLFCSINTAKGDALWQRRFIWYLISASDRAGFNRSVARINTWDFQRIIPCHGEVIENEGKSVFQKVFQWHLDAAKKGN